MTETKNKAVLTFILINIIISLIFPFSVHAAAGGGEVDYGGGHGKQNYRDSKTRRDKNNFFSKDFTQYFSQSTEIVLLGIIVTVVVFSTIKNMLNRRDENHVEYRIEDDVSRLFMQVQQAWSKNDLDSVKNLYSQELFKKHQDLLTKMTDNFEKNVVADVEVVSISQPVNYSRNNFNVTICASLIDYTLDTRTDTLISGSFHKRGTLNQTWYLTRQDDNSPLIVTKIK